jgi:hypothetical protein
MSPGIAQITATPLQVTPSKRWRPTPSRSGLFGRDWGKVFEGPPTQLTVDAQIAIRYLGVGV